MTTPAKYSTSNILNSVSMYLADKLLEDGMLCYWHAADALQIDSTASGWYYDFNTNRSTILQDATVSAAVSACRGIVTILSAYPAEPRFIHRLISDASLGPADEVPVPALVVDVTPVQRTSSYELGTRRRWRPRAVLVEMYARHQAEQRRLADWAERALEEDVVVEIRDHDAGTLAVVGDVQLESTSVSLDTYLDASEALAYQVVAGAYLMYVA